MSRKKRNHGVPVGEAGGVPVGEAGGLSDCLQSLAASFGNMGDDVARVLQGMTTEQFPTAEQLEILDGIRKGCNTASDHAAELAAAAVHVSCDSLADLAAAAGAELVSLPEPLPVTERIITT